MKFVTGDRVHDIYDTRMQAYFTQQFDGEVTATKGRAVDCGSCGGRVLDHDGHKEWEGVMF